MATGMNQSGMAAAPTWGETSLPRLAHETELQKMLADEKMRSEQHRTNYQTLKAEHKRLQDEYVQLQGEMKATIEDTKLVQEKYKNLLEQAKKDLLNKQAECDELRNQVLNPDKLDLLRIRVQEDVEKPFREKFLQFEEENDRYRTELNKLKYEYSFLKAEYEHEKAESVRVIEETKLRHEAEVSRMFDLSKSMRERFEDLTEQKREESKQALILIKVINLRKERETILSRSQNDGTDAQRVRTMQRENAQLHMKIKGLLSELEEIRAQREHLGLQSDSVSRLQTKQLAEHSATVKALETERNTLKLQLEGITKELSTTQELQTQFTAKIHDLEKDNIVLKNRAEEVSHKSKVELTNLKMDMLKERGDLERQRDKLKNQIEDLKSQLDIHRHTIAKQEDLVANKERECVRKVQAAREEEWTKLNAVEHEKVELETKLQEMERRKIDEESRIHAEREKTEDRLQAAKDARESAEKEALVLKTKVSHQDSLLAQLERERQENSELKNRLHRIESTYQSYINSETELVDINTRLKNEVEVVKEDLRSAKEEIGRNRNETEKIVAQKESGWTEERLTLQHRLEEVGGQYADLQRKLTLVLESNKSKKKKISRLVSKLKNKIQYLSAKLEELAIERDALRNHISPEQHLGMKKKLNDIIRRHREFRNIILSENLTPDQCRKREKLLKAASLDEDFAPTKAANSNMLQLVSQPPSPQRDMKEVPIGEHQFGSIDMAIHPQFLDLANQHEKELSAIKERLDQLDDNQRAQLHELKGVSPIVTPIRKHRPRHDSPLRKHHSEADSYLSHDSPRKLRSGADSGSEGQDLLSDDGLDTEPVQGVKCS